MPKQIKSEDELKRLLLNSLNEVVKYVLDNIDEENVRAIDATIYGSYDPIEYDRTYEFREAWRQESNTSVSGSVVHGKYSFDGSYLSANPVLAQHASLVDGTPFQVYLADVIYNGTAGILFGNPSWAKNRNAYNVLNKWLDKTRFRTLFEEGMSRAGLTYHHNKSALKRENI